VQTVKSTLFKSAVAASAFLLSVPAWAQQDEPRQRDREDQQAEKPKKDSGTEKEMRAEERQVDPKKQLSSADKEFVIDAAIGGLAEVEMGRLAQDMGVSDEVKEFGVKLVTDHEKANRELETAVAPYGVMLPTRIDEEHQKHIDMLKSKKGMDFDKAFATHMVQGHEKMIKLFKKEVKSGKASELKEFATRTLPALQDHLKISKDLAKPKGKAKTSSL
jgi:putative membrane protein